MTFGCAGHNNVITLKKKLDWKTRTFKGIHLATFDTKSKSGLDIRCGRSSVLDTYNERPRILRTATFKPNCADVIANHRTSPATILGAESTLCGEISFLRAVKEDKRTLIHGDFTLEGPKARIIAELIEDNGYDFQLFFSPKIIMTDNKDASKMLVAISTFNVTASII